MFFKKKDDKKALPDLPPMQGLSLPKLPVAPMKPVADEEEESFPSSKIPELKKNPAVSAKEAVEDESDVPEISTGKKFKAVEMEEWTPETEEIEKPVRIAKIERAVEMDEPQESAPKFRNEKNSDIFVKLDKFRSARRALEEIKIRTEEIDSLLKKIRETKLREEQELTGWEKEISNIKSRVQDVSSNIFEKVE